MGDYYIYCIPYLRCKTVKIHCEIQLGKSKFEYNIYIMYDCKYWNEVLMFELSTYDKFFPEFEVDDRNVFPVIPINRNIVWSTA
jgi:hypothetical protein